MTYPNRILLNISGEFFPTKAEFFAETIATSKASIAVVCGGGNILRGGRDSAKNMQRAIADQIGMTSTIINSLFLYNHLSLIKPTQLYSALQIQNIKHYNPLEAVSVFNSGTPIIIAGGAGQGYISTDTAAVLRAKELQCHAWVKVTKYDQIYDSDPALNPQAQPLTNVTYEEILEKNLGIMDRTAAALAGPPMILVNAQTCSTAEEFWGAVSAGSTVT
jgi:uridylate kinase